jgi:hypothetical protein
LKKSTALILLVLISAFSFAQKNIELGLSIRPQIYSAFGKNTIFDTTNTRTAKINLAGGISFGYRLNKDASLLSGIFYQPHGISNETFAGAPSWIIFESRMKFARIPVLLSFNIMNTPDYSINFIAGVGLNYLVSAKDNMQKVADFFTDGSIASVNDRYNKVMLDGQFSFNVEKLLSDNLFLFIQADGIIGLSRFHSRYSNIILNSHVFSTGIDLGIKYIIS